jgi:hypothetical protein
LKNSKTKLAADERRLKTNVLICVYLCSSAANIGFQQPPSASIG